MKRIFTLSFFIDYWIPFLLFVFAFAWRYTFITARDISLDEPYTIFFGQRPFSYILAMPLRGEATPPLFMLLTHLWIDLWGGNLAPQALRTLPLLISSLTVVVLYRTALKNGDVFAGLLVAFLFLFSTMTLFFALEVRTYSLLSLFVALAIQQCFTLAREPGRKRTVFFLLFANLGIAFTHHFGWLIIGCEGLFVLFYFDNREVVKKFLQVFGFTFIAGLPFLLLLLKQFGASSKGTWITAPRGGEWIYYIHFFLNNWRTVDFVQHTLLLAIGVFVFFSVQGSHFRFGDLKVPAILFLFFVIPYFTMYFMSYRVPMFVSRYTLFTTVPFYLFIGVFINKLFSSVWQLKAIALLCISLSAFQQLRVNPAEFYYRDIKKAVNYAANRQTDSAIVILSPDWSKLEYSYHRYPHIFKSGEGLDSMLVALNILPVDKAWAAADSISAHPACRRFVFYLGEDRDVDSSARNLLQQRNFRLADSVFFEQCNRVLVFDKAE